MYIARSRRTLMDRQPEASFGRYTLFGYSREAVQLYSPSQDGGELGEIRMTCSGSRHSSQMVANVYERWSASAMCHATSLAQFLLQSPTLML